VLGRVSSSARIHPCTELVSDDGPVDLAQVLDRLGGDGIVQLMVEGGANVAGQFHRAGLVDRYVIYVAPAFVGGQDGTAVFGGPGVSSLADAWRGTFRSVTQLGNDLRIDLDRPPAR
jgi:diaminohydroxyphosphoribosylaminopyrimidine deaminase / 5-amino-6-(5-phosphoribosylamino)uracil reductase